MSILPTIPRDPPARLRLMSLWFALFAISVDLVTMLTTRLVDTNWRLIGIASLLALCGWLVVGYRRQRFPEWSTPIEALLLIGVTGGSALPMRSMGIFLAAAQLRSLYISKREFWLLPTSYGIARIIGVGLTAEPRPYEGLSVTVGLQIVGIIFFSGILFMLMQALEAQGRAEASLRDAQKMKAVGQLAGGIAHDFNNLLTVISGHVYMLERSGKLGAEALTHLAGITETTQRAGSLTRQLLAFGRRQMLHPTNVDLNAVVRAAVRLLQPVVGERIRLVAELDPSRPHVQADVNQLEQVLLNLGLNARDAMPRGGTLRITTATVRTPAGPQARVSFEDTGVGMDAETVAHVFEPFYTTKRGGRGSGLGLATAYGIVKQSGGDIGVTSALGKGTTFTISLPVIAPPAVEAPDATAQGKPGAASIPASVDVRRILLVEDNDEVRNFVRAALANAGVAVVVATDGAEGLAVAREEGYAFDLVISDVVMPALSGPQMVARLREARPELGVLFMTGYADDALSREDLDPSREALIEKPFTARALLDAVVALSASLSSDAQAAPAAGTRASG